MTSQQILQSDLLDVLFENRNKLYGAYQLRRSYQRQLIKAVVITVGAAFFILLLLKPSGATRSVSGIQDSVIVRAYNIPPPEQPKPEPPKPPVQKTPVQQRNFTDHLKITEKVIADPLPPVNTLEHAAVSNVTTTGDAVGTLQPPVVSDVKGRVGSVQASEPEPKKEAIPDRQPQFPGGMQAWQSFLAKNLRSPEELESGERRTVVIRFHVAEDGSVTQFTVEKSAGAAFDEEVIRVLKKMPRWTPALQGGRPVSVSFAQPVTFVAMD